MTDTLDITIWDTDCERVMRIDQMLRQALHAAGIRGRIQSMSEPPLVERMNLTPHLPVLEIQGKYWSLGCNRELSVQSCECLLKKIVK